MTLDTVFDLASLTKPLATAASVFVLVERGLLQLDAPASLVWPELGQGDKAAITIRQLLTHTAGLMPDTPLEDYRDRATALRGIVERPLVAPPGERFLYSDVGYQILGEIVERQSGLPLDVFATRNLFEPLGMAATRFGLDPTQRPRAAPTERREGRWIRGEVHDPRAAALGGVAGHAGLFSTAADVGRFAAMLLRRGEWEGRRVLATRSVELLTAAEPVPGGRRTPGFDVPDDLIRRTDRTCSRPRHSATAGSPGPAFGSTRNSTDSSCSSAVGCIRMVRARSIAWPVASDRCWSPGSRSPRITRSPRRCPRTSGSRWRLRMRVPRRRTRPPTGHRFVSESTCYRPGTSPFCGGCVSA